MSLLSRFDYLSMSFPFILIPLCFWRPCWLTFCSTSAKSLILTSPHHQIPQFLSLRETNVHLWVPSPFAHWLPETQLLPPLKCCVQNGDSLHGKFAQLPAAYPLHKFKECLGVVLGRVLFFSSLLNQFLRVLNIGSHEPCNLQIGPFLPSLRSTVEHRLMCNYFAHYMLILLL